MSVIALAAVGSAFRPPTVASQVEAIRPPASQAVRSDSVWDVTVPRGKTREIDFTTQEGTWISVDVSPDGRWVVFDLLAHIYRLPIEGGVAEPLTQNSGIAVNVHPRYSPDGKTIAFVSDRGGQSNLWLMDADGANPRPVVTEQDARVFQPVWTPDGNSLIVMRQSTSGYWASCASVRCELWQYHRDGGKGVQLTDKAVNAASPSISPDGKYVYFHHFTGLREVLAGAYQLQRLEIGSRETSELTAGQNQFRFSKSSSGSAYAPEVSPDGRWLAFARRLPYGRISFKGHEYGPRTALWLRDLRSGTERLLMDPIELDAAEEFGPPQVVPRYGWTRDGKSIVVSQGGKLRRLDIESGRVETIPFTARVRRTISERAYAPFRIGDDPLQVKFTRWQTGSPDGRRLAFQAVGRVWVMDLPRGAPRRLTPEAFQPFEFGPAWSPDGRWVAFTTWDDTTGGHLWRAAAAGGSPERLTTEPGEYLHPAWSPDGLRIVMVRGAGATAQHRALEYSPWYDVVTIPARGGTVDVVSRVTKPPYQSQIPRPMFGPDGRLFYPARIAGGEGRSAAYALVSVLPNGSDRREHLTFPYADEIAPSPTGRWVAFNGGQNVYLAPFPPQAAGASPVHVDRKKATLPITQLSREDGLFVRWRDPTTVEFGSGPWYFAHHVETGRTDTVAIHLEVPRGRPRGTVALRGARLITMENRQVIENGTLMVRDGRIACVGGCDTQGAHHVVDVSGRTIIPGFIDMHAHGHEAHRGVTPRHDYESAVYLAYGVTATLDPSVWSQNIFPMGELIEAGQVVGSRTFSTGGPLYYQGDGSRQNELSSYQVTDENLGRLQSWGAVSIKQYIQPRRAQRQWVAEVARKRGLMLTAEGSGGLAYMLSLIMDGHTGWEHSLGELPIYADAAKFFGQANAVYSATLGVSPSYPSWNAEFFVAQRDLGHDPKLSLWRPWRLTAPLSHRRVLAPKTDYNFPIVAQGMADIIAEGGHAAIGNHGEMSGLGTHWEVWMAASAMGPMAALEVASRGGAYFLGADRDLGSLAVGKLADLMVLNANPLDDIRNTEQILYVMKDGRLYDGTTLDELWPMKKPYGPRPWVDPEALRDDVRPLDYWDRHRSPKPQ